jgi:hypothetical protein
MTRTIMAEHSLPDDYPSSYDAVSGNNHGVCVCACVRVYNI